MSSTRNMRLEEIITILKDELQSVTYPQSFPSTLFPYTNCYSYAVGVTMPDKTGKLYYPGGISNMPVMYDKRFLLRFLKSDLRLLGVYAKEISLDKAKEEMREGKQVIAFFYSSFESDFHFLRKDRDGGWSHKRGYEKHPEKVEYDYEEYFESYDLVAYLNLSFM